LPVFIVASGHKIITVINDKRTTTLSWCLLLILVMNLWQSY